MSGQVDHMGAFVDQLRRETDALDLHPFAADHIHWRFAAIRDQLGDVIVVRRIMQEIRQIAARELRYLAENYKTMPGPKQSKHPREAYRYRRQADRFEARP